MAGLAGPKQYVIILIAKETSYIYYSTKAMHKINEDILSNINESDASSEAKKKGLTHKGYGNYADNTGKTVAQSRNGKLQYISKVDNKTKKNKKTKIDLDHPGNWKDKFNAKHHVNLNKKSHEKKSTSHYDKMNPLRKKLNMDPRHPGDSNAVILDDNTLKKLDKLGYQIIDSLGSGSMGTAYLLSNNKVLKVGEDEREAEAMGIIKRHPHPNVVSCERSFYFKDSRDWSDPKKSVMVMEKYFIVEEKLDPLPSFIKHSDIDPKYKQMNFPLDHLFGKIAEYMMEFHKEGEKESEAVKNVFEYFDEEFKERNDEWDLKLEKNNFQLVLKDKRMRKFLTDMVKGFNHLFNLGINWQDAHFGNVMYDSKSRNYKIIDLGTSYVENPEAKTDVEKLEESVVHVKKAIEKYGKENLNSLKKAAYDWLEDHFDDWIKHPTYLALLKKHNYDISNENLLKGLALENFFSKVISNDKEIRPYLKRYNLIKEQWKRFPDTQLVEEPVKEVSTSKAKLHDCNNCIFFKEDRLGSHMLFSTLIIDEHYCVKESEIIQKFGRSKEEIKRWLSKPNDLNSCPSFQHRKGFQNESENNNESEFKKDWNYFYKNNVGNKKELLTLESQEIKRRLDFLIKGMAQTYHMYFPNAQEGDYKKFWMNALKNEIEFLKKNKIEESETFKAVLNKNDHPDDIYNKEQLEIGIKIEMEHTPDPEVAKKIAKDHLDELPNYYVKLLKYVEKDENGNK